MRLLVSISAGNSLSFMLQVIFETLRLATVVNGVLRKTTQETQLEGELDDLIIHILLIIYFFCGKILLNHPIKFEISLPTSGFSIPKDWKIYVYIREQNYDPLVYPEPLKFNPWRWMVRKNELLLLN